MVLGITPNTKFVYSLTILHTKYGLLLNTYFRYLICLLDRVHIITAGAV